MESHSRRGAGLPAPSPTSPRDLPDPLACPRGRRKGRNAAALATTYCNAGLGARRPRGNGSCPAGSDGGCLSLGVCTSWRQRVEGGEGEWREKEQREAKGCEKGQEVLTSSLATAPSADRPPPRQTPGRGSPCPAQHQTRPARHAKSPQRLSTGVNNIGARRQQKREASGEQTPARPEPSGGTGRMLRRSDCSRRPRSPSATVLAQGAWEGQEGFSSDGWVRCSP